MPPMPAARASSSTSAMRTAAIGMHLGARQNVEREGQQRVAGEDRGRLVVGLVRGRLAAAQVVIVHRRQVVVHQRIAVHAFERGSRRAAALLPVRRRTARRSRPPETAAAACRRRARRSASPSSSRGGRAISPGSAVRRQQRSSSASVSAATARDAAGKSSAGTGVHGGIVSLGAAPPRNRLADGLMWPLP